MPRGIRNKSPKVVANEQEKGKIRQKRSRLPSLPRNELAVTKSPKNKQNKHCINESRKEGKTGTNEVSEQKEQRKERNVRRKIDFDDVANEAQPGTSSDGSNGLGIKGCLQVRTVQDYKRIANLRMNLVKTKQQQKVVAEKSQTKRTSVTKNDQTANGVEEGSIFPPIEVILSKQIPNVTVARMADSNVYTTSEIPQIDNSRSLQEQSSKRDGVDATIDMDEDLLDYDEDEPIGDDFGDQVNQQQQQKSNSPDVVMVQSERPQNKSTAQGDAELFQHPRFEYWVNHILDVREQRLNKVTPPDNATRIVYAQTCTFICR